jgi:nuclear protein localization family protein 4
MTQQDEEALAAKVAISHDLSDGVQLLHSQGWATLMTILESSGERPPKRQFSSITNMNGTNGTSSHRDSSQQNSDSTTVEQLAKRVKNSSIGGG